MLEHVGQGLLDDPVRGQVEAWRQGPRYAADLQFDGQPGRDYPVDERLELRQAWLRAQVLASFGAVQGRHLTGA